MKAQETNLLKFLQTTAQYIIPVYQRPYRWDIAQCKQLWTDILRAGNDPGEACHFIGSIVYISKGLYTSSSAPRLLVIDGQQRLTTLTLLLTAFAQALPDADNSATHENPTRKKIAGYYLFNNHEQGDLRYKLLLTRNDRETLTCLLDGKDVPKQQSHLIMQNFRMFSDLLRAAPEDWDRVWIGIQKLIIVDIALDRDRDNPQLIFESLNATGLKLSQADLIRNYILMGLEPEEQKRLYEDYWFPMESEFGDVEYTNRFDAFMRDFLTVKTGRISKQTDVYSDFKWWDRAAAGHRNRSELMREIYSLSRYYVQIALHKDTNRILNRHFRDINSLHIEVAYPFLLEVYQDYEVGTLTLDDFVNILCLIQSYIIRRAICDIPSNSHNHMFAGLLREIHKDDYLNSFLAALIKKDATQRFPSDEEFHAAFTTKNFYNFLRAKYCLAKLENHGRKELVDVSEYTVEHILPQNPNLVQEWQDALGQHWKDKQIRLLHTVDNLTLTGCNSEYSDRPFRVKRDMSGGFKESPLQLNRGLGGMESWGEEQILSRGNQLATLALEIWPYPQLSNDVLARYQPNPADTDETSYNLNDHTNNLPEDLKELFEEFRTKILNLDHLVREEVKKHYIAYKITTNFVDVQPQKRRLRLFLNMRFEEIDDPKGLCRDVTAIGRVGNGDVEVGISRPDQMEDVIALVMQAFDKHMGMSKER